MGQRLVITVRENNEDIAAIYYHWSAYSCSALMQAREVINAINDDSKISDLRLRLIRFCEDSGGCIDGGDYSREYAEIQKMYPEEDFKEDGSRNNGMIAITEEGIKELQFYSEGDVVIDLDDEIVYNDVLYLASKDEMEAWKEDFDNAQTIDFNLSEFPMDDIDKAISVIDNIVGWVFIYNNMYYELIE